MNNLSITLQNIFEFTWPMILIFATILSSFRIIYIIKNKEKLVIYEELITLLTLVYLLCLFYVVTFQDVSWSSSNFIPFKEITRYTFGSRLFIKNILGNILIFIPFGFSASYYLKNKKVASTIILTIIASVVIEVTQYKIGRVFDIDDILLNISGGVLGHYIYTLFHRIHVKLPKVLKNTHILNIIVLVLIILVIIYFIKTFY